MRILALEVSSKRFEVAIAIDNQICFESVLDPIDGRTSTSALTPFLSDSLNAVKLKPAQIDVMALTIGPGSFTSLRIACVTAKAWSYATKCRLVGIPTHDIIARQNIDEARQKRATKIWVLTDAQRRQIFATSYEIPGQAVPLTVNKSTTLILDPAAWQAKLAPSDAVAGAGIKFTTRQNIGIRCHETNGTPQAKTVAELAWERAERGEFDDLWTLTPLYVRPSAAEEKHQIHASQQDQK